MKRRGFLGTIGAAIAIPAFAQSESKPPFNTKVLEKRKYALDYAKAIYQESLRNSFEAVIFIKDGKVYLDPLKPSHLRPGDSVMTDKKDMLYVVAPHLTVSDMNGVEYKQYLCSFMRPKTICRRQVIQIAGKYRLLKNCDGLTFKVNCVTYASMFREGGVSS